MESTATRETDPGSANAVQSVRIEVTQPPNLLMADAALEFDWAFAGWPSTVRYGFVFLIPLALGLAIFFLSRFEMRFVPRRVAIPLLALRWTLATVMLGLLLFDPRQTEIGRERIPGRILIAVDTSDSMRVTDPQRSLAEKLALAKKLEWTRDISSDREVDNWIAEAGSGNAPSFDDSPEGRGRKKRFDAIVKRMDDATRLALAERALVSDGAALIDRLKSVHAVEVVGWDQKLVDLPTDPGPLTKSLDSARPYSKPTSAIPAAFTDLKLPLARAGESGEGRAKLLGLILFTDGRHNWGESPRNRVAELAAAGVPIFPVVMAPKLPPPKVSVVAEKTGPITVPPDKGEPREAVSDRRLPTVNAEGTISFGTLEPKFRPGREVEVHIRAGDDAKKLGTQSAKAARVVKLPAKPGEAERAVGFVLFYQPEGRPCDLVATLKDLASGQYAIELDIPAWADQLRGPAGSDGRATHLRSYFEILPAEGEELSDLSANGPLLEELATATGGKVYTPETLDELADRVKAESSVVEHRTLKPLRQSRWLLGVILGLFSLEWGLRKWNGLA